MPTALLAGAFGQRNPGDEALLSAFLDALPGWDSIVPAANPAAVADRRARVVPATARATLGALRASDAVVFAGGTVFKVLDAATGRAPHALLARGLALARGARLLERPVALVGVGAGALPGRRSRALARALAGSADMLVLRDDASADVLAEAGVPVPLRVGADAAWTLLPPPSARPDPPSGDARLVVTLSRHAGGLRRVPALAAGLAEFLHSRPDVDALTLQPWQIGGPGHDDLDLARELQRALRVARGGRTDVLIAPPPPSVPAASAGYRGARLVLGQRFHSLLAAAAAGTRFVAVAHEAKSADLASRLGQQCLRPDCSAAEVAPVLAKALDGPPPDPGAVAELRHTAQTMLALLHAVVDGGHTACPDDLRSLHLHPEAVLR